MGTENERTLYEIFETDDSLEEKGFALEVGTSTFILARAGGANKKFQRYYEKIMRPHRAAINAEALDEDVARDLLADAYSKHVILAWSGVKDREGKPLTFTPKNVVKLLLDLPELFTMIMQESQKVANFTKVMADSDAKS